MRKFEKISFEQFKKDVEDDINLYNSYLLPTRKTKNSAGYDISSLKDFVLKPNETIKLPTGIKIAMEDDEVLMIFVRSSQGFKYNIRMCNQVGIIDSDYYNNESNEGHLYVRLQNEGEIDYIVKKGDAICQAIFTKYLITDNDESNNIRNGGLGSTNKE